MTPPSVPGPSNWEIYEHPSNTSDQPPPYTEHDTSPISTSQALDSRQRGSRTYNAGLTDPPEYGPVEPTDTKTPESERLLFTHVVPHVIDFIHRIGHGFDSKAQAPSTSRADLYLVPEAALPAGEDWQLSGADYLRQSCSRLELTRVATPPSSEKKQSHSRKGGESPCSGAQTTTGGFSELSGDLWWRGEDLARRLAGYLDRQLQSLPPSRLEKVSQTGGQPGSGSRLQALSGNARATVRTEEMTFRRENDMGLWESKSGWTIIISANG